jgi:hypothetical protein
MSNTDTTYSLKTAIEEARLQGYYNTPDYQDPSQIQESARKSGFELTKSEAGLIWEWWSDRAAAGWLHCDDDKDVEIAIRRFIDIFHPQNQE